MSDKKDFISIWFFIGSLLTVYGVLIFGAGVWDLLFPHPTEVKLAGYHASLWWGLLLLAMGLFYVIHFWPRKENK